MLIKQRRINHFNYSNRSSLLPIILLNIFGTDRLYLTLFLRQACQPNRLKIPQTQTQHILPQYKNYLFSSPIRISSSPANIDRSSLLRHRSNRGKGGGSRAGQPYLSASRKWPLNPSRYTVLLFTRFLVAWFFPLLFFF